MTKKREEPRPPYDESIPPMPPPLRYPATINEGGTFGELWGHVFVFAIGFVVGMFVLVLIGAATGAGH